MKTIIVMITKQQWKQEIIANQGTQKKDKTNNIGTKKISKCENNNTNGNNNHSKAFNKRKYQNDYNELKEGRNDRQEKKETLT